MPFFRVPCAVALIYYFSSRTRSAHEKEFSASLSMKIIYDEWVVKFEEKNVEGLSK